MRDVSTPRPDWAPADLSPLDAKLGIEIVDFDPDRLVATMPVAGNEQPFGLLHGGATCALAETVGSWAGRCTPAPAARWWAWSSTSATCGGHRRDGHRGLHPVRRGRTLATFLIQVTDDEGRPTPARG